MQTTPELPSFYVLDGQGGAREVPAPELDRIATIGEPLWVHLDRNDPNTRTWLEHQGDIDPVIVDALVAEETRPRCIRHREGLLVMLRGVNLNPGADPEDMIAIRMWVTERRMISVRLRTLLSVQDVHHSLAEGRGPRDIADLLVLMADRLVLRMDPVLDEMETGVDRVEEVLEHATDSHMRTELAELRRQAIMLRRYLAPQREVMMRLQNEPIGWFNETHRVQLREIGDRVTRYVEALEEVRERALVTHEDISGRLAEQMNRTMYTLALVATVFLPLGLITGLLGINVAGIPGAENPDAFLIVCGLLVGLATLQMVYFSWRHWFK